MKLESQLQVFTASGVAPFTVNRTTLVTNLNAQYLNGQLGTYYAAASSLSSYLPLAGGTLTGGLTVSTQLSVLGATATDILRLYVTGSTIWKLGVTDASGSALNISADFGSFTINKSTGTVTTPGAFVSTVVTGTAPLTVASTTLVTNLNAQYLNGQAGSYYQSAGNLNAGTLLAARLPAFSGDVSSTVGTVGLTLANVLVTPGTYTKVTANAKGLITAGAALASADLPTYTGTITSGQVTAGLGFTPYNATNPNLYITSSGSITGNAATATNGFTFKPGWAGNQNLIAATGNVNSSVPSGFYEAFQATNSPTPTTWCNLINVRHSNAGNDHGFQLAMSYYDETLWSRSYQGGTGANNGTFTTWRAHLHSGNFNSYALPLAGGTLTGGLSGTTGAFSGTLAAAGAITQGGNQVLHAGNYTSYTFPRGGSWYGANLPGTRWGGMTSAGGEIVFGQDLPAAGQMGILIDGCYIAAENNGFWSLASSNDWTTRRGMYFDGTYLRFDYNSATAYFSNASIGGNQVLHAGNYTSYPDTTKLPLAGGTLTGQVQISAGHGNTRFQLYENYNNDTNHAQAAYLTLWASEPGLTWTGAGIGANINIGGQYYGRAGTGQAYGVYIRFDAIYGRTEFYNTTGIPGIIGGQGTLRAKIEPDGEIYATASLYKVLHAGNHTSYSPPLGGTGATGTWPISITGNASGSSASAGYLTGGEGNFYGILYNNTSGNLNLYNTPGLISAEYVGTTNNPTGSQSNGHFIQISDAGGTDVKTQWYYQSGGIDISMRLMWGNGSWLPWRKLLHDGNYNSYALPLAGGTLTGSITATNHIGPGTGLTGTASGLNIGGNANNITQYTVNQSVGTGNSPSFTGLSVVNTITGAVSGNAGTVTNATFYRQFTVRDDRSDGGDYSLAGRPTGLYAITAAGTNGPGATYLSLIHVANSNDVAFQIAGGYISDNMYFRGTYALQNGTGYSAWRTVIHSGNIASQTVATAGSCTGSAAQLNGQASSYYENRDTTAVGFSAGTLTLTRAAGNLTVSLDGRYLTANQTVTLSGDVTGSGTTSIVATIANSTVTNAKLNTMGAATIKGNNGAVANSPLDLTVAQVATMLSGQAMNINGASASCTGNAASASAVAASGITGQTGMWTSAARPGPYRLYRRDVDDAYSVQNYWTGSYWRLDGYYSNNTVHAGCSVSYADAAGSSASCSGNAASVTDGVYLSNNQSISGVKTFSSAPVAANIAKAWVRYDMTSNTINASFNVSSVTDNGTGDCTVNFSSSMVDANYVVAGTATYGYDNQVIHAMILAVPRISNAQQAGSCRLVTEYIHAAGVYDSAAVRAVFYR